MATTVKTGGSQPYDPDGFLKEFARIAAGADPVVLEYLTEAVHAFNAGCYRSAAVMLGGASEKSILVLHEAFGDAITDTAKRKKFEDASGRGPAPSISTRFNALKERLDIMVNTRKLTGELAAATRYQIPAVFELIRRCRNDAGHPEIPTETDPDTVFLSLRVFTEQARLTVAMTEHFKANPADF